LFKNISLHLSSGRQAQDEAYVPPPTRNAEPLSLMHSTMSQQKMWFSSATSLTISESSFWFYKLVFIQQRLLKTKQKATESGSCGTLQESADRRKALEFTASDTFRKE